MNAEMFATLKRLSATYRAEFHRFVVVEGKRVNRFGLTVDQAYVLIPAKKENASG